MPSTRLHSDCEGSDEPPPPTRQPKERLREVLDRVRPPDGESSCEALLEVVDQPPWVLPSLPPLPVLWLLELVLWLLELPPPPQAPLLLLSALLFTGDQMLRPSEVRPQKATSSSSGENRELLCQGLLGPEEERGERPGSFAMPGIARKRMCARLGSRRRR